MLRVSNAGTNPAVLLTLFSEVPALVLFMALLTLMTSGIALGFAVKFSDWQEVRHAEFPGHRWLAFLLVLGSMTGVTLLAGGAFLLRPAGLYLAVAVPGAIISTLASWRTYHALQQIT